MGGGRDSGWGAYYFAAGLRNGERKPGGRGDEGSQGELAGLRDPGGREGPQSPQEAAVGPGPVEDALLLTYMAGHGLEEMLSVQSLKQRA